MDVFIVALKRKIFNQHLNFKSKLGQNALSCKQTEESLTKQCMIRHIVCLSLEHIIVILNQGTASFVYGSWLHLVGSNQPKIFYFWCIAQTILYIF